MHCRFDIDYHIGLAFARTVCIVVDVSLGGHLSRYILGSMRTLAVTSD